MESAFWNIAVTLLLLKGCNLILGFEQVHLFLHITQVSSREFFCQFCGIHAGEQNCTNAGAACIYQLFWVAKFPFNEILIKIIYVLLLFMPVKNIFFSLFFFGSDTQHQRECLTAPL